ncbi:MAG TPA: hypothetical protein VJ123_08965 [Anaerolineales bacterium]|nr:hypothetical protein [Anaerolineales bacterium]
MLKGIARVLSGDPQRRELERYAQIVEPINALEDTLRALDDEALQAKTGEFRRRIADGETLDDLLPEAFAVVREAAVRTIGMRHFDVQLIGGAVLHHGKIAEMRTGEGKTLVATLPIYLNGIEGLGVHLVTVNDYLARRDARWMGPVFHFLGLSVGVLQDASRTENGQKAFVYDPTRESVQEDVHQLRIVERNLAYRADVTYGTNNEFGFDYLRDNMAHSMEARVQREHHYAILDEVDNILIDEARTPLIISGPSHDDPELYFVMARVVSQLGAEDAEISERDRTVSLTEIGEEHVERLLGRPMRDPDRPEDISPEQARLLGFLEQGLRAQYLFKRNKDYVVQGGRVIIVDEFTGRMMPGRRWSDGLHQAVEAKEGVRVRQENVTYATITLQNFFRKYRKLAGMTGTALTEAEEFNKIYKVDVTALPTNLEYIAQRPDSSIVEVEYRENGHRFACYARRDDPHEAPVFWRRKDYPDVVFRTEEAKLRALTKEILARHVVGQPLLVGTTSVELSERLSNRLRTEPLARLANALILRDAFLEAQGISDEGLRVEALEPLYAPIEELNPGVMRPFARELGLTLNPTRPENLERLGRLLDLTPEHNPRLGEVLTSGIRHNVLNAKKHDEESRIIADAGALGAVTIATNMAGRGVDIKLGGELAEEVLAGVNRVLRHRGIRAPEDLTLEERVEALSQADGEDIGIYQAEVDLFRRFIEEEKRVKEVGGLHVIGSERHESRRIDNQLRGRSARQGDPGSSQFYLSLQDELMRLFGGEQVSGLMQRLNIDDAVPIAHNIVNRTIEQAQTRVEGANFDTRKHLLEYDDVLNQQREVFYGQRNRVFGKEDLSDDLAEMLAAEVERHVQAAVEDEEGPWKLLAWLEEAQPTLGLDSRTPYPSFMLSLLLESLASAHSPDELKQGLLLCARQAMEAQYEHLSVTAEEQLARNVERLKVQARQRVEMAELAIDGLLLEVEEGGGSVDPKKLLTVIEEAAAIRLELDASSEEQIRGDPSRLRRMLPQLIETGLGFRVWAGTLQAFERRIGEELGLPATMPSPVDWDEAGDKFQEALTRVWEERMKRAQEEIQREVQAVLAKGIPLDDPLKLRLLVQMSYAQRTVFDRRTHQRASIVVPRLSYAFSASRGLTDAPRESLIERIMAHLDGARQTLIRALGQAELNKLASSRLADLEPRLQSSLLEAIPEPTRHAVALQTMGSLPQEMADLACERLGRMILTEWHRSLILSIGDRLWVDYLTQVEALRTSIGLEAYGQRDPLVQYKSRAFDMFQHLLTEIRAGVVSRLFQLQGGARAAVLSAAAGQEGRVQPAPSGDGGGPRPSGGGKKRRRRR